MVCLGLTHLELLSLLLSSDVLVALAPVIAGVLILPHHFNLLHVLLLMPDSMFLDLPLQLHQISPLFLQLLELLLVDLIIPCLLDLFFLDQPPQLFNLLLLLLLEFYGLASDVLLSFCYLANCLVPLLLIFGPQTTLFCC